MQIKRRISAEIFCAVVVVNRHIYTALVLQVPWDCQGFVAHSTTRFLREVRFSGQELRRTVKNLSEAAERSSN